MEPSPIIINKSERFSYKPNSAIHEAVVATLRKEKDTLTACLANQRELNNSQSHKIAKLTAKNKELEKSNQKALSLKGED